MSILIEGMEMPTRCFSCPMCEVDNAEVNCAISHGSYIEYREVDPKVAIQERPSWCPLVPVPPHGRLIDADASEKKLSSDIDAYEKSGINPTWNDAVVCVLTMPTVIPAEESNMDSFIRIFEEDDEEDGMDSFIRILKD